MTRLRFTIRDLLWLTAVIAIGTAWFADRAIIRRERDNLEQRQAELDVRMKLLSDQRAVMGEQVRNYSQLIQQLQSRLQELNKAASMRPDPLPNRT